MVTDQQVLLLRRRIMEGKTQQTSAAAAGMSARSARRWRSGPLPSERKKDGRRQSTRPDPFAGVWEEEIVPLLQTDVDRILHLAAAMECEVERALKRLIESRVRFDYAVVKQLAAPASPEIPEIELSGEVDLGVCKKLLTGGAR